MKTNSITRYFFVLFLALILWGCKKDVLKPTNEEFKVKSFISNIKSYNVNSEYNDNIMPTDTTSADKPYVSVQSWVIKGKDILMSITVPDDAEELYFGAINSQAEYMGLNFEGQAQNQATGYYRLKLSSISNPDTATNGLRNYQVVLSSNENIQIDKFDLLVSCKTTKGISNKTTVPVNVASIAPYQKNLKVGFRPLTGYTYTIKVSTPSGAQITYSYNKNTGTETFNNSQVPNTSLSYDSGLDFKWIDFSDPEFGGYSMAATIQIDLTGGSQYIYLYLAIVTEGIIEQVSLDANIQQTGQNTAVGTANVGFSYFAEFNEIIVDDIKVIIHKPDNFPLYNENYPFPSTYARRIEVFEGMTQHTFRSNYSNYPPDKHLQLYHKDALTNVTENGFQYENIQIILEADIKIPSNFDLSQLNEVWRVIEKPDNVTNISIDNIGIGKASVTIPPNGGVYKFGYKPIEDVIESEAIFLLPLASPEVKEIILNDLTKADAFANKVNNLYQNGYWHLPLPPPGYYDIYKIKHWFFDNLHGDYIGRPDCSQNPTVWYYNQVNDENMRGAILTWFGIPTRLSDVSYFLAGYTLTKINAPEVVNLIAQYWAGGCNYNDQATQIALLAGIDLAKGIIKYNQVKTLVQTMFDKTLDNKNTTLWPNNSIPNNYSGSYPNVPPSFNPNTMFASPCYTNPDFELK
ncbi:MAG: hypothetical protein M0R21_09385 [Lentimicrobiaceae bacterium]|nr:hypothetical protein [Lentimicrobiaceae bacterium]